MHYRDFGKTGLKVAEVGLGCGPLGSDPQADCLPPLERALELPM
jgi:aryl-alcohol dehydrogenase-like predicted oxidoreductase